jgi:hypothetical protein
MRKAHGEHFEIAVPLKADPSLRSSERKVRAKTGLLHRSKGEPYDSA